jgi:hypothetical protein
LASEERLVDLDRAGKDGAVDHRLVALAEPDVVALDDLRRIAGRLGAAADKRHRRPVEEGELVERALGAAASSAIARPTAAQGISWPPFTSITWPVT